MTNDDVTNTPMAVAPAIGATCRYRNADRWRAFMRELMRKRRAAARA